MYSLIFCANSFSESLGSRHKQLHFPVLAGRYSNVIRKDPRKIELILKTHLTGNFLNGHIGQPKQVQTFFNAQFVDVLIDRHSGFPVENTVQMAF